MDNKDELQEFDLDEILSEFHDDAQSAPSQAADEDLEELLGDLPDLDLSDEEAPESEEESPQSPVQEDAYPDSQPQADPAEDTVSYTPQAPAEETAQVPTMIPTPIPQRILPRNRALPPQFSPPSRWRRSLFPLPLSSPPAPV